MKHNIIRKEDRVIIKFEEEKVEFPHVRQMNNVLNGLMHEGFKTFELDFEKISKVHSNIIGILLLFYTRINKQGGKLILNNPPEALSNLLKMMDLNEYFNL